MTTTDSRRRSIPHSALRILHSHRGFTLMELLIVMLIISLLAALALAALQGATEEARADRTRAVIAKIDQLIMERYDGYLTRTLPIRIPTGTRPTSEPFVDTNGNGFRNIGESFTDTPPFNGEYDYGASYRRLMAMRELMRMELPDRRSDIINTTTGAPEATADTESYLVRTAMQRTYYRKILIATGGTPTNWSAPNQGSECLYLIISSMHDGDKNALDFFTPSEIGDTDQDGMREILDGWGTPIAFLRWAPGYRILPGPDGAWGEAGVDDNLNGTVDDWADAGNGDDFVPQTMQTPAILDPYDPMDEDRRTPPLACFALRPLIFSAGRDRLFDINIEGGLRYAFPTPAIFPAAGAWSPNDPYYTHSSGRQAGMVMDTNSDNEAQWPDNITNHFQETN